MPETNENIKHLSKETEDMLKEPNGNFGTKKLNSQNIILNEWAQWQNGGETGKNQ